MLKAKDKQKTLKARKTKQIMKYKETLIQLVAKLLFEQEARKWHIQKENGYQ